MLELNLTVGEDANELETAIVLQSLSSVLQWCFFIVLAIIVAKYIRKENATPHKTKHSQNHHRKGR